MDSSRARAELDWNDNVSFEQGVDRHHCVGSPQSPGDCSVCPRTTFTRHEEDQRRWRQRLSSAIISPSSTGTTGEIDINHNYLPQQFADHDQILAKIREVVIRGDFTLGLRGRQARAGICRAVRAPLMGSASAAAPTPCFSVVQGARHRQRRRGHHHAIHVLRDDRRHRDRRRQAGLRRRR